MSDPLSRLLSTLAVMLWLLAAGCGTQESKRIEQLLNQKGFGGRTHGDAQVENYVAAGDAVQFFLPPTLLAEQGTESLAVLAAGQRVSIDGTIFVPFVGAIPVLGLTERELGALVSENVQAAYNLPISLQARIVNNQKWYFTFGEFMFKGRKPLLGDYTVLDAFADNPSTPLANIGRFRLVRPDPKNPLVVHINIRDMILEGDTTWNIGVKEHDILYLPPTFFGAIARVLERILLPFTTILNSLFQAIYLRQGYRSLVDDQPFYGGFYGGGRLY